MNNSLCTELELAMIREKPLKYISTRDVWLFNFAMLNVHMQTYGVRLNPNVGDDVTVADYLTYHDIDVAVWFYAKYKDPEVFIPINS